jgi:hypothetical protein
MYSKNVTEKIVEYWALGYSAEETRGMLLRERNVGICLTTIYKHRHSLTAQNLIDELMRRQERAILKADTDDPALAMKYRNELLKILVPQRIESLSLNVNKSEVKVDVADLLKQYEDLFEEATILENCAPKPIRSSEANG